MLYQSVKNGFVVDFVSYSKGYVVNIDEQRNSVYEIGYYSNGWVSYTNTDVWCLYVERKKVFLDDSLFEII